MSLQGPYPQQPKKGFSTGCIVAIVVVVVGAVVVVPIVAALGIYGVRRYLASAKTAEAKNVVSAMARAAEHAYEDRRALCGSATPVPVDLTSVANKKYLAGPTEFAQGSETVGWKCLRFSLATPSYFQLHYHAGSGYVTAEGARAGASGFEAAALGDLDGDGVPSHFARSGTVDASGHLALSTQIYVDNEFE